MCSNDHRRDPRRQGSTERRKWGWGKLSRMNPSIGRRMDLRTDALQTGDLFVTRKIHILLLQLASNLGAFRGN